MEQREVRVGPEHAGTRCLLKEMQLSHRHQRDPGDALRYVMSSPDGGRVLVSAQEAGFEALEAGRPGMALFHCPSER